MDYWTLFWLSGAPQAYLLYREEREWSRENW